MKTLYAMLIGTLLADTSHASPLRFLFARQESSSSQCPSTLIPVSTNDAQASIIQQQEWNLCSYKSGVGHTTPSCSSYGMNSMAPFFTTTSCTCEQQSRTYIATYLTDYATLTEPTKVSSTDCGGGVHTFSVGELGQVWSLWQGVDINLPLPTPPPPPPICTHCSSYGPPWTIPYTFTPGTGLPPQTSGGPGQPSQQPGQPSGQPSQQLEQSTQQPSQATEQPGQTTNQPRQSSQ
ncbi:hypothetical protein K469DRAFT_683377 [Zopfia rhizophila CBS 207.26]|uniref:Uncharacterized protein n=1 Tax=Zopfia rhizophila CBS 207.26 TaxID=1314779 RepID=A0A6A6D8R4_9PEZI|nr:hypothetical protein K469DRAFT_683377 [Zopfia rhizophila CBS 207.26]